MNRASTHGGGILCYRDCSPAITNCVFKGNRAGNRGGGIYSFYNSYPVITNCTITDNSAALYGDGLYAEWAGLTIKNSIVWGNVPKQITSYQSTTLATYNNIQGGYMGDGNIDVEPLLTPDSHLRSQSPCLDAGDPTYSPGPGVTDIDGELRVYGSRVDVGVDEFIDTDSDGLPDWWEQKYFADPTIANASDDPDEDGQDNLAEYNGSSDPLQAQMDVFYVSPDGNDDWDGLAPVWDGVHGPKLTIQASIDAAVDGDEVVLDTGTYTGDGNRDIDFLGKAITVRSLNGPETCIINCEGTESESHRGFYFHAGEGPDSVLSGLTITNGYAPKMQIGKYIRMLGGAIYCDYSSPVITNCIFRENISGWKGGAIMSSGSKPKIINCLFQNNVAQWGGGLHTSAVYGSSQGPIMTNCTFVDNFANNRFGGGGVYCDSSGKTTLTNCILWGNTFQGGGGYIAQVHLPNPVVSYCCIEGSFGSVPLLAPDGYHLLAGSPCINTGNPGHPVDANESDIDGQPRIIGGRVDIGADEFHGNNARPIADAGEDQIAYAWFDWLAEVILDGSGSYDDDGHVLTYLWRWTIDVNNFIATGPSPRVKLPVGEHVVELVVNDRVEDSEPDEVIITVVPPVQAGMRFTPQALNPSSKGRWVKAHFVLPEGYVVEDVDTNSPTEISDPFYIGSDHMNVFVNEDDLVEIEAAFDRAAFCATGKDYESVEVTVVGLLASGQYFYGMDTIRIITNHLKFLGVLASHWLENCGNSDYCDGIDLNEDSVVNFKDFSMMLDGCCIEIFTTATK
jgi:parallel beta-helix repeat protein